MPADRGNGKNGWWERTLIALLIALIIGDAID